MSKEYNEIEYTDYSILQNINAAFYRLWKLKLVVVFTSIIFALCTVIYVTASEKKVSFYSTASIYSAVYGSYSDTVSGVNIMNTYSSLLNSSRVCGRAAADIGDTSISTSYLQSLVNSGKVSLSGASTKSGSYGYKLVLQTELANPTHVVKITNAMAKAFASEINELLGEDVIQVFDEASASFMKAGTSSKIKIIIAAILGFILSAGFIFVKEFFSSKVYLISQCVLDKNEILGLLPVNK